MLAETLMALAALAGNTVVAAATSDAWEATRRGFVRLLGRGNPDQTRMAEQRLTETHDQLTAAQGAELERVRATLAKRWAGRLADLLEEHPDAEADLRTLLQEIRSQLPSGPVSPSDHSVAAAGDVNISAPGGVAAGVIHGDVMLPDPTRPGPANS